MSLMSELYRKETGESALGSMGFDDDDKETLPVYVEGYTKKYIQWLEVRAARSTGQLQPTTAMPGKATNAGAGSDLNPISNIGAPGASA